MRRAILSNRDDGTMIAIDSSVLVDLLADGPQADAAERLEAMYLRTRHKRTTPTTIHDTWWKDPTGTAE